MDISAGSVWLLTVPMHPARLAPDSPTRIELASTWVQASRAERQAITETLQRAGHQAVWQRGAELEARLRLAASTSIPSPPMARKLCPAIEVSWDELAHGNHEQRPAGLAGQVWEDGLCVFCGSEWQNTWASPWYPHPSICDGCARTLPSRQRADGAPTDGDGSGYCSWCFRASALLDTSSTQAPDTGICFDCADLATIELDIPDDDYEVQYDALGVGPDPTEDDYEAYADWAPQEDFYEDPWLLDPPDGECDICGDLIYGAIRGVLNLCAQCQADDNRAVAMEGPLPAFLTSGGAANTQ